MNSGILRDSDNIMSLVPGSDVMVAMHIFVLAFVIQQ